MRRRHEYYLDIADRLLETSKFLAPTYTFRHPLPADLAALAELMLDAYQGTIDYDGETLEQAEAEVSSYFAGQPGEPSLDCSWLCFAQEELASAYLVSWWPERRCPIISYIMTRAAEKDMGLGTAILLKALASLNEQGYSRVGAVITSGNRPSETIFRRAGFSGRKSERSA